MGDRKQLQELILRKLERGNEVTVDCRMMEDMLSDPNEKVIGTFGINMNEAILLAGGKPSKTEQELFDQWCIDNGLEWDDNHYGTRTFRKSAKETMRQLLIEAASRALRWNEVDSVEIGLEPQQRFEGRGWNGRIRLRLLPDTSGKWRDYGYIFVGVELERVRDRALMLESFKRKFDAAMAMGRVENGR